MHTYTIKETFRTIQGEGHHAGMPAVFVRFAGCNMWNGDEAYRVRDSKRTGAECPRWCDTDFVGGFKMTADQVAASVAGKLVNQPMLVVLSGGEPLLQVDLDLLAALYETSASIIAIETNGTTSPRFDVASLRAAAHVLKKQLWVTMSPKLGRVGTKLIPEWVDELKLVYPAYDPNEWADWPGLKFLQPQARQDARDEPTETRAANWVQYSTGWRLSLQLHKVLGVP